jgi:hypothetical protein
MREVLFRSVALLVIPLDWHSLPVKLRYRLSLVLVERHRDYGPHNTFDAIMLAARVLRREALREVALFSTQF